MEGSAEDEGVQEENNDEQMVNSGKGEGQGERSKNKGKG